MESLKQLRIRLNRDINNRDLRWEFRKETNTDVPTSVLNTNFSEPLINMDKEALAKYVEFLETQILLNLNSN